MAKFRARARTVDLLGRQQIAGIPTALHELFKNAHDAYADHVEVDYFPNRQLLVLRDDGIGMSREDFVERWLVVGTESKLGRTEMTVPEIPAGKEERPVLGEKGIGRLAVGILGKQLLVISRPQRKGKLGPFLVALIHWDLFALPGIDLDDIDVPLEEVSSPQEVNGELVGRLVETLAGSVESLGEKRPRLKEDTQRIKLELDSIDSDPFQTQTKLRNRESLSLQTEGWHGTQFWVLDVSEVLKSDTTGRDKEASKIEQLLLGFSNTATPDAPKPRIQTAFWLYGPTGSENLLDPKRFFEPDEFQNADQYILGDVDQYGHFKGTVSVFGETHLNQEIPYSNGNKPTKCGPFKIHLGYVQGFQKESTLPDEDFIKFREKSEKLGGVYVYIDGIRVLPYWTPEYDWLRIEERRSKHATHYFFSHRRMCGAVLLARDDNEGLVEKAGREGFQTNTAYNQFRDILEGILIQLAARFFRREGLGERFHEQKQRNVRANERRAKHLKSSKERKKAFKERLQVFVGDIEKNQHVALAKEIESLIPDSPDLSNLEQATEVANFVKSRLNVFKDRFSISAPSVALDPSLQREFLRAEQWSIDVSRNYVAPLERKVQELFERVDGLEEDVNQRLLSDWKRYCDTADAELHKSSSKVERAAKAAGERTASATEALRADRENQFRKLEAEILRESDRISSTSDYFRVTSEFNKRVQDTNAGFLENLKALERQYNQILKGYETGGPIEIEDPDATTEAFVQKTYDLEEELSNVFENAQIGTAVAVISHEFDHHIQSVREQLRALKKWADKNPALRPTYDNIVVGFEHLDSYLSLFTPLQRRLYRSSTVFSGREIFEYISRLFRERLADIKMEATPRFLKASVRGYPSTYYPVFVNLVDNAMFWLQERETPTITFDFDGENFFVVDNGPGLHPDIVELVFEPGFTLKPGGRGIGLAVGRKAMRNIGGDLRVTNEPNGAKFWVVPPKEALQGEV